MRIENSHGSGERMSRPYQPSNGSEGEGFHAAFCDHCARDAAFRETGYEGDPALGCSRC